MTYAAMIDLIRPFLLKAIRTIDFFYVNLLIVLERADLSTYYYTTDILNYSSSFLNPIVYALRIPEFKQALGLCCFRRRVAISMEGNKRRDNRVTALMPMTELKTLPTDSCHLNSAYEQDILDTKL